MSLSYNLTISNGVTVTFWTLSSLVLNTTAQIATIVMTAYLNSDAFTNGNDPVTTTIISITFVPTNALPAGVTVIHALYNKILLDPFFSGATYTDDSL